MKIKRTLSFVLASFMLLSLFGAFSVVFAETCSGTCGENVFWSLDTATGVLSITGSGDMAYYSSLTAVPWYDYKNAVTAVEIHDGVTNVEMQVFSECENLISVDLGNTVTKIGWYAFAGCSSLTSVTIPDSVTSIGTYAFSRCDSIESVTVGNGNEWILKGLFPDSYLNIKTVTLTEGTTRLNEHVFDGCKALTSVTVPDGVASIGKCAFCECSGLTSIDLPDSVTSIEESAFWNCTGLTAVVLPDSVTCLGGGAFSGCTALESIHIPKDVATIGERAFENCKSLTDIMIPESVTSIGYCAFIGCESLTEIRVVAENNVYLSMGGVLYDHDMKSLICCPNGKSGPFTIPDGVISLEDYAFNGCGQLTSVIIPNSVTSLGCGTFGGCAGLENAEIPAGVASLPDNCFSGCTALKSVNIPNGVTSIGYGTFNYCRNLTDIMIPDSVTHIGECAFCGCKTLMEIKIPNGVTVINAFLFEDCRNLKRIVIPKSVTFITDEAFLFCVNLEKVYYGGSRAQWIDLTNKMGDHNEPLLSAKVFYNAVDTHIDPAKAFSDISKKAWYYGAVDYAVNRDYFSGANGKFDPNGDMTRGMFVSVLARMAGAKVDNNAKTGFSDVKKGQWYTGAVKWAGENGIVTGSDGKFMPNDPITREQICTVLVTYAKYMNITLTPKKAAVKFKDAKKISKWAKAAVTACQRAGLVEGTNGSFYPKNKASRAEVAQILMNFDKNFG